MVVHLTCNEKIVGSNPSFGSNKLFRKRFFLFFKVFLYKLSTMRKWTKIDINNLILLCPNCHSLTPTYKALNKGNGRHNRMKRYNDGKSY